jgi:hypothetical protein
VKRSGLRRTSPLDRSYRPLERRTPLNRGEGLKRKIVESLRGTGVHKTRSISAATPAQRRKVKEQGCIVCGPLHDDRTCGPVDPAHVIPRSLLTAGQDDPRAVVGLGRLLHQRYDRREQPFLDLLPFLAGRPELDFAIERYGHDRTIWRVTNTRPGG